jgi:exosortase A
MTGQAAALRDEPLTQVMSALRGARVGLVAGVAVLGLLFYLEAAAAVRTWIASTAYNHCFLVIPIALYLIWDRRAALRGLTAEPMPLVTLLALPLGIVWFAAERLGIMEGRQLAAISMAEVLFLAVLGRLLWSAVSGPLLYLYFLVPFGEFLTPTLQDVTTWFTRHGLDLLGVPAYIDGYIIEIPEGTFLVAEACAGLRFLIASIAFGVLYALLMYRSPIRRGVFIAVSIVVPIVANGIRAMGIVWLGHILGSAEAAATDHVLYGWIFFSIVILLLIALGLPFRQDTQTEMPAAPPMSARPLAARHGWAAAIALVVLAAIGPAAALALNQASAAPDVALRPLDLAPSCVTTGTRTMPQADVTGQAIEQRAECGGTLLNVTIEAFSPRSTAAPVNAEQRRLTRLPDAEDLSESPLTIRAGNVLRPWRLIRANQPAYVAASGLWIDGQPTSPGITMRIGMARDSLTGVSAAPVLVVITPVVDWSRIDMRRRAELERQIADLLEAHREIGDQVRAVAKAARSLPAVVARP